MMNSLKIADARDICKIIPNDIFFQTTISSPPYYDMKDYGIENQVGYGQTYEDYLEDLKIIFQQVYEKTKQDGTLWIVIDTFKRNNVVVPLPFDLAERLKGVGWLLQDVIIWKKDKTIPWANSGFMQRKFEYILFFSKSPKYKNHKDSARVYDTTVLKHWWVKYPERYNPKGKALDEVWEYPIPVQGSWGKEYIRHFCPLPKEMIANMIQTSTDEGDIVFDPFAGTGSVLAQAAYMNRDYVGIELNPDYVHKFKDYLSKTIHTGKTEYESQRDNKTQKEFETLILNLRALKFGRLLINHIDSIHNTNHTKVLVEFMEHLNKSNKILKVRYSFVGIADSYEVRDTIKEYTSKPPLSKFGIEYEVCFLDNIETKSDYYFYSKTNSYSYIRNIDIQSDKVKVISPICVNLKEKDYE